MSVSARRAFTRNSAPTPISPARAFQGLRRGGEVALGRGLIQISTPTSISPAGAGGGVRQ